MTLASFGSSPNCQRYSGNFWAAHSRFLQQMNMHNELSLVFDPFWPLLPWTLQQDKQSQPEQYLANIFALRKSGRAFCAETYCWTHYFRLPWARKATGAVLQRTHYLQTQGLGAHGHRAGCWSLSVLLSWLTNSERRLGKTSSNNNNNVIVTIKAFFSTLTTSHVSLNKP